MESREITSSYRLQLSRSFTFRDAKKIVPYLSDLGVMMIYSAPFFSTVKGSDNPYQITDIDHVNKDLHGDRGFKAFLDALVSRKLFFMVDIVSNHMAASIENRWFSDLLKHGKASKYADYFDIDWSDDIIYLPVLSKNIDLLLDEGSVKRKKVKGEYYIEVEKRLFPIESERKDLSIEKLLEKQHYKLISFDQGRYDVNYRRFFDIFELIALKMENPEVYDAYHATLFQWIAKYKQICGVRIDHIDGLYNPKQYLECLRKDLPSTINIVEKILQSDEPLEKSWPVDGSVGYDYVNLLLQLFVYKDSKQTFESFYRDYSGFNHSLAEELYLCKFQYIRSYLVGDLNHLVEKIADIATEISQKDIEIYLVEFVAHFPTYRTYITEEDEISKNDREVITECIRRSHLGKEYKTFCFEQLLSKKMRKVYLRLQQLLPVIYAKGYEDTFIYRHLTLFSENEVGSSYGSFGLSRSEYFSRIDRRSRQWPHTMCLSNTHDTKTSFDVKMRLNVLSEKPAYFQHYMQLFDRLNHHYSFKDKNMIYLLYQAALGIWEVKRIHKKEHQQLVDRLVLYIIKAARESKVFTNWIAIDVEYEKKLELFVRSVFDLKNYEFLDAFKELLLHVDEFGKKNSLSGIVIKLTSIGIVDTYQGEEYWKYVLVDPDNRRDVDYDFLKKKLTRIKSFIKKERIQEQLGFWYDHLDNGYYRMYLYRELLHLRRAYPKLFIEGSIIPLKVKGPMEKFVIAYLVKHDTTILFCTTFRFYSLWKEEDPRWQQTTVEIPHQGNWINLLTKKTEDLSHIFSFSKRSFPCLIYLQ